MTNKYNKTNRLSEKLPQTKHIVFRKWTHPLSGSDAKNNSLDGYNNEYDDDKEDNSPIIMDMFGLSDFKFYIGYTDFRISNKVQEIIDDIDGVESVEIFTPYRLRISVGKLFEDRKVISNINNQIRQRLFQNE